MRNVIVVGMGLLLVCASAHAALVPTLNGSTVTFNGVGPNSTTFFSTQNVLVQAPFPEVSCPGGNVGGGICNFLGLPGQLTIQNLSIVFTQQGSGHFGANPYNGLGFFSLNFGDGSTLTGFNLVTNLPGLTSTAVSFTPNSIQYNFQNLSFTSGVSIELDLTTSSTPEPSNILLVGFGLAAIGLLWRVRSILLRT
jgi:hypothetical protein